VSDAAPLVAIVGPTGSGKSDLALHLCEALGGEVVNCDSLQLYRYFDIGTAKAPVSDRRGVPHHLIDILDPGELFTAGEYARRARPLLEDISARGRLPVVVGGTGFYLRALIEGLFPGPARDEVLRARLDVRETRRAGSLHRILSRFDPAAASAIHPHDVPKTIRALEVCLLTRRPMSAWFGERRDALTGFRVIKIGLDPPRDALYQRIDARCEGMFEAGLVDEARAILAMGYPKSSKPFESLGYSQALQVADGAIGLKEAIESAQRDTRRYAKRQRTWFRADPEVEWLHGFGDSSEVKREALERVRARLDCV